MPEGSDASTLQLSQQYHPDVNKEAGAREKFQKVSEAWAVLKDGRERSDSDQSCYDPSLK